MKSLREYLFEGKNNLSEDEKKLKEQIDKYFNFVMKEVHYPKLYINEDDDKMPKDLKEWFCEFLEWLWEAVPEEYYAFVTKYYLRKQFIKSRVKLPADSFFDVLYNKWKDEIKEAFEKDKADKEKKRKEHPEYYK